MIMDMLSTYYKKIGKIRSCETLYKNGMFEIVECTEDIFAFARYNEKKFSLTVINRSDNKYHLDSNVSLKSYETGRVITVFNPNTAYILQCNSNLSSSKIEFYK